MNRGIKIAIVGTVLAGLWWKQSRLPKIKVIRIVPEDSGGVMYHPAGVEYEMSINGNVLHDTFYQGDERQVILAGDGQHYFISEPTPTGVTLSIGTLNTSGGFDLISTGYIAYDYMGNDLPVRIAGEKSIDAIIKQLKKELKWRNDYQRSASDGKYVLIETIGDSESKYTLVDELNIEVKSWRE